MKIFDLGVSRYDNLDVIRCTLGADDVYDDKAAEIIGRFPNFEPMQYVSEEKSVVFYAREDTTLAAIMMNERLDKRQVLCLLEGVAAAFQTGAWGVPVSYIVKDPNYVYINRENLAVKCIAVPVKQETMSLAELSTFFRNIISNMMFDERDTDNYVASLLTNINSVDFSANKLRQQIDQELNKIGRPVPPMGQPVNQPVPPMGQPVNQQTAPQQPQEENSQGSLMGQLGSVSKPVPHIIRKKTGEHIYIKKPVFSIGKSKTKADYPLEDNPAISRVHCIIVQKNGVNYIKDNHSTNHTFLNGVELEPDKEMLLKHKSVIQMGDEEFTFLLRKGD